MSGLLSADLFFEGLSNLKLVSVDLLIRNEEGSYLLGYRQNKPAQHRWFVPGGVVRKPETIEMALDRVCRSELGISAAGATFSCLAQHEYEENFQGVAGVPTHYLALAYELIVSSDTRLTLDTQHAEVRWWGVAELLASPSVHPYTQAYFEKKAPSSSREVIVYRACEPPAL